MMAIKTKAPSQNMAKCNRQQTKGYWDVATPKKKSI